MLTVKWHFVLYAYELMHIFVCKDKRAVTIVLRILGTAVHSLVSQATRCSVFVHAWVEPQNLVKCVWQ